ncbi:sigma-70 family RNA polymerase sigma factor [Calycomorphotria hydatis]|uniref:RNA polymerase sigma factor n=1 Tax=Calycomorphotria hydatis TaxID=2528027 RepID=A0A517TEK6_9PLAN|nr:sigma-70 family RNA polymerase sigma factor [Calycomorphotria hydatis]QDT66807.1 RNA polymerase sigma factor [Calycomorphotria hydatis]
MESKQQERQFTKLLTAHRRQLYSFVYSLLADHSDAEDVYQRCSMILWEKFDKYDPERDFQSWAMGIAFYEVKNFLRVSSRDRHRFSEHLVDQLFERVSARGTDQELYLKSLQQCLKSLAQKDRRLVQEVYWERRQCSLIARELGIAVNTLYDRVGRIRGQLRKCIIRRADGVSHA